MEQVPPRPPASALSSQTGCPMPTYLMLFRFTAKGVENIKQSPERVQEAKKAFARLGAEVKDFYLLLGHYDTMFLVQAPNDETATRCALAVAAKGNVRTETLRAFSEEEYGKIVAGLP